MNITNEKIIKLEIKQIAAYLPYRLKYLDKDTNELTTMRSISTEINLIDMGWGNAHDLKEFKPILRPLSDLTKEIEFDNEKFTPSKDKYWGMNSFQYHINQFENWESPSAYLNSCAPYGLLLVLIKWHFDVFGLIDAGLAIDINTL